MFVDVDDHTHLMEPILDSGSNFDHINDTGRTQVEIVKVNRPQRSLEQTGRGPRVAITTDTNGRF